MFTNAYSQKEEGSRERITPFAEQHGVVEFLDRIHLGLLLASRRNEVIACTSAARSHLERCGVLAGGRLRTRALVRALSIHTGQPVAAVLSALRSAQQHAESCAFDVHAVPDAFRVDVHLHPSGGWAAIFTAKRRQGSSDGSVTELNATDALTNLPNRASMLERLKEALIQAGRGGKGCAVLLVNLDRFRPINDALGNAVGDRLLAKVADRLRSTAGSAELVGRLAGDEFVVLQATSDLSAARVLASRIVDLVGRTYVLDGHMLNIGASVGIAHAPRDASDADALMRCADLALHHAKGDGRGTFRAFEPEMDAKVRARRSLETDLRRALARREFQLFYQPQLSLTDNRLVGCEALIRWLHPERGQVSPAEFIPLAEETGLIGPIGEWVIRQACRDAVDWPKTIKVAVNVSPAQFKGGRLVETVLSALASAGLPAERLEIEITEGVLLEDNATTLATLNRLRQLGVGVSMDDFGTGYSSLSYLRSFPFGKIKIDRSFVKDMAVKPDGDAVIRAVSSLGRSLGMTTVAEGVETREQMERIRAQGCNEAQGYLISRPVPSCELMQVFDGNQDWSKL